MRTPAWQRSSGSARWRVGRAWLVSLVVHAALLSLSFGEGLGLPGLDLPWQQRRGEAPALSVVLTPLPTPTSPPPLDVPPEVLPEVLPVAPEPAVPPPPKLAEPAPTPAAAPPPAVTTATLQAEPSLDTPAPPPAPRMLALERPDASRWSVPPSAELPSAVVSTLGAASSPVSALAPPRELIEAQRSAPEREAREREFAQLERTRLELQQQAQRLEAARIDAERAEAARVAAERAAQREAAARAEAERQEAVRREAARQEAAKQEAARAEAARQEAARQDAARAEAARQAAARQEAARQDTAKQELARQATARADAARAYEEQREARLRAIGRQLDEEAARRDAANNARSSMALPPSVSTSRRGRMFGRIDSNAELQAYSEAWARKIQLNRSFEMLREAAQTPHTDPMVTVSIRDDGSVEKIEFVRSSGVPALDEAIRRVVLAHANYPAFPPALARDYDVIEIRRTWHFDMAIRLD